MFFSSLLLLSQWIKLLDLNCWLNFWLSKKYWQNGLLMDDTFMTWCSNPMYCFLHVHLSSFLFLVWTWSVIWRAVDRSERGHIGVQWPEKCKEFKLWYWSVNQITASGRYVNLSISPGKYLYLFKNHIWCNIWYHKEQCSQHVSVLWCS